MRHLRRLSLLSLTLVLLLVAAGDTFAGGGKGSSGGDVSVKGYYRKDGTYVAPHVRSAPDGNPYNNYGFPGNYNPNTGSITPGNPDTYLENYNRKRSGSSGSYITIPSLNTPTTSPAATAPSLPGGSSPPVPLVTPSPAVSTGNIGARSAPDAPVSLDRVPMRTWSGPRSLDR